MSTLVVFAVSVHQIPVTVGAPQPSPPSSPAAGILVVALVVTGLLLTAAWRQVGHAMAPLRELARSVGSAAAAILLLGASVAVLLAALAIVTAT
ncbi:hypothetical protein [Krasilnikovia sp. MM14-A1004]|uniref:hypothetical protein n=1 Tax=Krasilnikovia sp. MM14-A1004 TaxID=3373541 RepID=UPI00399CAEB9